MTKKKKMIIVNKKYFQDRNDLFMFAQGMLEFEDGIDRYHWMLYRNDHGYWHSFAEDGEWKVNQNLSAMEGIEILKSEWMEGDWTEVNYQEPTLMIAGNVDMIDAKERIIDLIRTNLPELTVKFI